MKHFAFLLLLFYALNATAQEGTDQQLAQYYFAGGQFEKALPYCQKLYQKENSKFNFTRYYECLLETNNLKEAEKLIKI